MFRCISAEIALKQKQWQFAALSGIEGVMFDDKNAG